MDQSIATGAGGREINSVHGAIQQLQYLLMSVDHDIAGVALDAYVLAGMRLDTRLLDLCKLVHAFLGRREPEEGTTGSELGGGGGGGAVRRESEHQIRKCLELFG